MAEIQHERYGRIKVRRHIRSKYVRLSVGPNGTLSITAPLYTPLRFIKHFLKSSRQQIDSLLEQHRTVYEEGSKIGKSHRLIVVSGEENGISYKKPTITVTLDGRTQLEDAAIQSDLKEYVAKALRNEAKAYLPRRLEYLAEKGGFQYSKLRFSHAKGRWGSCSSDKTISLNIALMKLDFDVIDYVIIHELAHTRQLNHSPQFWKLVEEHDPLYRLHRKLLKQESPHI